MAKAFTAEIQGLDKLLKKLEDKDKALKEEVFFEIEDMGKRVVQKAKQRAPKDVGALAQSIYTVPLSNGIEIVAAKKYAAFVEFGTGTLVDVPAGLEDYAIQFKGRGIRQVNLPARPFFFNSFFEEKTELIKKLEKILSE